MEPNGSLQAAKVIDKGRVHTIEHCVLGGLEIFLAIVVVGARIVSTMLNQETSYQLFWYSGYCIGIVFFISGLLGVITALAHSRSMTFLCALFGLMSAVGACAKIVESFFDIEVMEKRYQDAYVEKPLNTSLAMVYSINGVLIGSSGTVLVIAFIQMGYSFRDLCFPHSEIMSHLIAATSKATAMKPLSLPMRHLESGHAGGNAVAFPATSRMGKESIFDSQATGQSNRDNFY